MCITQCRRKVNDVSLLSNLELSMQLSKTTPTDISRFVSCRSFWSTYFNRRPTIKECVADCLDVRTPYRFVAFFKTHTGCSYKDDFSVYAVSKVILCGNVSVTH